MTPRPDGKTPQRVVRVSDELWARFGAACEAIGTSRSDQMRVLMSAFAEEFEDKQQRRTTAAAGSSSGA